MVDEVHDAELARERVGRDRRQLEHRLLDRRRRRDGGDRANRLEQLELVGELLHAARRLDCLDRGLRRGGERVVVVVHLAVDRAEDDDHVGHDRHDHRAVRVVRAEHEPALVVVDAHGPLGSQRVRERRLVVERHLDDAGPAFSDARCRRNGRTGRRRPAGERTDRRR